MSIQRLPSSLPPLMPSDLTPAGESPRLLGDAPPPLPPIESTAKSSLVDRLADFTPTFNDGREVMGEHEVEPNASVSTTEREQTEGSQSEAGENVETVDEDASHGGGGDSDDTQEDGTDSGAGEQQGGEHGEDQGDSHSSKGGDQHERQRGERGDAPQQDAEHDALLAKGGISGERTDADRRATDRNADTDLNTGGRGSTSRASEESRTAQKTAGEDLMDPASGALRAAIIAAGQRLSAEQASTLRRPTNAAVEYEANEAERLQQARRVEAAETLIQHRDTAGPLKPSGE